MTVNNRPVAFTKFRRRSGRAAIVHRPENRSFPGWTGGRDGQGATIRMDGKSTGRATILSVTAEVAQ